MNDEFENALAWFSSAPSNWIKSAKKDLTACAEWIWEVLQGDFNENASTAQVVTGTIISMIPFVDQICDVRDVVANCKNISKEPSHSWHWISLVLTLIGLFPTLGSFVKGCGKVMFASFRKAGNVSGVVPKVGLHIDQAVVALHKFLARPEVTKAMRILHIDNPFKHLATEIRTLAGKLNTAALLSAFDAAKDAANSLLALVQKWGNSGIAKKVIELRGVLDDVRLKADKMLPQKIRDVRDILDKLARRLDWEADMAHRAHLNAINPHAFSKYTEATEAAAFAKAKPSWVDDTGLLVHSQVQNAPSAPPGWRSTAPDPAKPRDRLANAHKTFHTIDPVALPPGTVLYRVVDPTSADNSICWMTKAEFEKLKTKDDWRRKFAVWANWNSNGEYVTYVVPPGKNLNVWEGVTASQRMDGTDFVLEGGARQIVIHPDDLDKAYMSKRKATKWGYGDFGVESSLVGVPVQTNKWY